MSADPRFYRIETKALDIPELCRDQREHELSFRSAQVYNLLGQIQAFFDFFFLIIGTLQMTHLHQRGRSGLLVSTKWSLKISSHSNFYNDSQFSSQGQGSSCIPEWNQLQFHIYFIAQKF